MYCPRCFVEYGDDFTECTDCRLRLAAGVPPNRCDRHALKPVTVLEVRGPFALSLAKTSLEEAGIDYLVSEEDAGYLPGFYGTSGIGTSPLWKCSRIQVMPEFENEARALLEHLQSSEHAGQIESDSDPGE